MRSQGALFWFSFAGYFKIYPFYETASKQASQYAEKANPTPVIANSASLFRDRRPQVPYRINVTIFDPHHIDPSGAANNLCYGVNDNRISPAGL